MKPASAPKNLIYPLFVGPGKNKSQPVSSMPGVAQLSVDRAVRECQEASALGIPAVILFGIPERKDGAGSEAYADDGVVQQAIRRMKEKPPEMLVITDVCLCEYTDHGHCGVIKNGDVDNDSTLELLAQRSAVSRPRRRGHRRAVGYDGWAGRRDSRVARRKRLYAHRDHGLRG